MEKMIPAQVEKAANEAGYYSINFCGTLPNGAEVYGLGNVMPDGTIVPTGLPECIVLEKGNIIARK